MGDIADFIIGDALENGWDNDADPEDFVALGKVCKFCGAEYLKWIKSAKRWRLATSDGKIHQCPVNPLKEK